jgi:lycopene cyclase domain-containing protein
VQFNRQWRLILPGLLLSGLLFLLWDYIFTVYNVWSFNPAYVIGIYILNLPIEEILFFITVPFACIFIYECLNHYLQSDYLKAVSKLLSWAFLIFSLGMLVFFHTRVYSLITFALLSFLSLWFILRRPQWLGRFYLAYFVSLLPFYIVNGLLTSIPVVLYNDLENCGLRVGSIPLEDHFYSLSMLMMNVSFFEYFKMKAA